MKIKRGSTSVRRLIFIGDSTSTTGAGLTGLAYNSSGLAAYYFAGDLSNEVQITLASATLGSYTSGGFVEVDATNMPGWYEVGIPNAALDGGNEVAIQYRGAINMVPVNIYIELDAVDYQSATNFGLSKFADIEADTQNIQSRLPAALVSGRIDASVGAMAENTLTAYALASDAAAEISDAVWDEPLTGATHNVATSAGRRLRQLGDTVILKDGETVAADNAGVINGTNGLGRIKLQPDVGTVCVGQAIRVASMVRFIEAYDADTQYATVDAPWCTIPEVGDEYTIFNLRTSLIQRITSAASGTIAFVMAKLWDMIEDVSGYRFTADALEQAPSSGSSSITITAGAANAPARSDDTNLIAFVDETISQALAIYEADGTTAKDMSGKTLTVVFENLETTDTAVVASGDITVSGDDNNTVTWAYPAAVTSTVGTYRYALRDAAAPKTVYAQGLLFVKVAAAVD